MTDAEARLILQACRPGEADRSDLQIAAALREVERNPDLARWFAEEQAFDEAMAAQLQAVPAPFGLKTRLLAQSVAPASSRMSRWLIGLAGVAALLFLLAQVGDLWRHSNPVEDRGPGYASEMVSFVKLPPPLEMESSQLGAIKNWLAQKEALEMEVPPRLAALHPVGCRVLSYRGHAVSLICFHRENGQLAHLFIVDRAALPGSKPGDAPSFQRDAGWMTASWADKNHVYMIALQGDEAAVQRYLPDA